jgi:hypothetical protein
MYGKLSYDSIEISEKLENKDIDILTEKLKEKASAIISEQPVVIKKKRIYSEGDEDEDELEEDEDGNLIRTDEEIQLDDEFDDTFGEVPDGYIIDEAPIVFETKEEIHNPMDNTIEKVEELRKKEEPEDDWGF